MAPPLDRTITEAAAQIYSTLPETVFLRAADCIHLVTALPHHDFAEIYSHDQHQEECIPVTPGSKPSRSSQLAALRRS